MEIPVTRSRRKKHALKEIEAKGKTINKAFELGDEEATIERQLGYLPTNVQSVAARGESGRASRHMPYTPVCGDTKA